MLKRQLILLATPRHVGVLDWRRGHLHWLGQHAANAAGMAAFAQIVARHAHLPAIIIADSVDEDYRGEILPHVQGAARTALVARKLKQSFRNAQFAGAWRQARETTGRRDDRYLFAALTDHDWLVPWLGVLQREGVPLAGITPMAIACQHLLARLRVPEPHVLMACRLHDSLRLSYYQDGMLRFSRLIPGEAPTQLPGEAANEIAKTQLYLTGQRILPRDARLHVLLLDPTAQLDAAYAALTADPAFSVRKIDVAELASALHIPDDFLLATPETVPLAAIAGKALPLNLAPAALLQGHVEYRWRRALHAVAGGIALAGLVATAALWLRAESLKDATYQLDTQTRQLDARYQAVARTFPRQDIAPEQLALTVRVAQALEHPGPAPRALMAALGAALDGAPDVVLEQLHWAAGDAPADNTATLRIDATLASFDGNYRAAMQRIENFMQTLASVPSLHDVQLRSSPVDTGPGARLTGKTQAAGGAPGQAVRFSVELLYREAAQ